MKKLFKTYANGTVEVKPAQAALAQDIDNKAKWEQKDLSYIKSIYLSTGANLNDDEFLPEEVELALHTIANKPINKEHKDTDIVGHMVAAYIVDKENKKVASLNLAFDTYFGGISSKSNNELNNHDHSWSVSIDPDNKLKYGYTSWDNGHRHYISAGSLKSGKTDPAGYDNHTHELNDVPTELKDSVVVASDSFAGPKVKGDFHVVTEGVLYSGIHGKYVNEVKENAKEGKAFVSMETYFDDYDYRVGTKLIKRNEVTAFLDQFLRSYGGLGEFDGQKVTRALRNLHFAGKGIVETPANPPSIIFASQKIEAEKLNPEDKKNLWDKIDNNSVQYIEGQKSLEQTALCVAANNSQPEIQTGDNVMEIKELEGKLAAAEKAVTDLTATVAAKDSEVATLKENVASITTKLEVATKEVNDTKAVLASSEAKLTEIKLAQVVALRKADFASFEVTEEDLKDILEEVKVLDDASYAKYLAKAKRLFKSKSQVVVVEEKPTTEEDKAKKAEEAIDSALASKSPVPLQGGGEVDNNKTIASRIAESIFVKKEKK